MSKFCQHCGKETDDFAAFCSDCGKAFNPESHTVSENPFPNNKDTAKKNINFILITLIIVLIIIIFLLSALVSQNNKNNHISQNNQNSQITSKSQIDSKSDSSSDEKGISENCSSETIEDSKVSISYIVSRLENVLETTPITGVTYYNIEYDDNIIYYYIAFDGLAEKILYLNTSDNYYIWNDFKDTTMNLYIAINEYIKTFNRNDLHFSIILLNDKNLDNSFLIICDGEIIYDVLDN